MCFLKKVLRRGYTVLMLLPAMPVVLAARLLRPLVLVRFGSICAARIGEYVLDTEMYFYRRQIEKNSRRTLDLFYYILPVCNTQLKLMWQRSYRQYIFGFVYWLRRANAILPYGQAHALERPSAEQIQDILAVIPRHLNFSDDEERMGGRFLRRMGIGEKDKFFCFHARDAAYLETVRPANNWDYHDHRDFPVQDYLPAVRELVKRGYFAFRMGAVVEEPLRINDPMVIDYALKHRTDFLDIYLSAKCGFFIGCGSGIDEVPKICGRSVGYINFIPYGQIYAWSRTILCIPKKLWLRDQKRFATFGEIFDSWIGIPNHAQDYRRLGIEIVNNTPEEILDFSLELEARANGTWQESREDAELQQRFQEISGVRQLNRKITPRIGAAFLRQNRELLR